MHTNTYTSTKPDSRTQGLNTDIIQCDIWDVRCQQDGTVVTNSWTWHLIGSTLLSLDYSFKKKNKRTFMTFLLYWLVHDRLGLREMGWFKTDVAKISVWGIRLSATEQLGESLMPVQFLLRCQKNTLAHVNNKSCTICTRTLVHSLNSQKSISPTFK